MPPTKETDVLTVATLREGGSKGAVECLFNERQQIFTLTPDSNEAHASLVGRLGEAQERGAPVKVVLNPRRGAIVRVGPPSPDEVESSEARILLERPNRPLRIDVSSMDPITTNIVDHYLKVPSFSLCDRIIPSYVEARTIFDFCAAQSCNLPGPPTIAPCIPFQYVIDGCYARAHQMRRIIEDRYGYCCEKVFSFANQGSDQLAVVASKWGGCCVTWWYHVAPLVRVRFRFRLGPFTLQLVLAMVIDPGMFDQPVLLSTWLLAQQNAACSPTAHVSMCSIQPGSAYTPANYSGTAFTTDPAYTATDATLVNYASLTTC